MTFSTLESTNLGVHREELEDAFAPFVRRSVGPDDPEWRAHVGRRRRRIVVKGLRRLLLPRTRRREERVVGEYSRVWGGADYSRYSLDAPPPRHGPWEWRGERMLASTIGATRFRQVMLARVVEHTAPRTVLEVGCGDGINLVLLAGRFPGIGFSGVELTEAGHERARRLQELAELPGHLARFAPLPLEDLTAFRRIAFHHGSAAELPFPDGSFDLVITVLALEQMEQIRDRALAEIARVASGHTFMIEPFRDVNERGWRRLNVLRRDYLRARVAELGRFGLEPVLATDDFPQEAFLHALAVLARRV